MFGQTLLLLGAAGALSSATPAAAQDPVLQTLAVPGQASAPAPPPAGTFPSGAEVLSVDGEPLGVLVEVETRPGGEQILHIRRPDGSMTTAPATVASRGERAVVLEWTRADFATGAKTAAAVPETPPSL